VTLTERITNYKYAPNSCMTEQVKSFFSDSLKRTVLSVDLMASAAACCPVRRLLLLVALASAASAQLSSTFYDTSCPSALSTIKSAVTAAVAQEARIGASLLRLHFHDCFVQASIPSSLRRFPSSSLFRSPSVTAIS
jgi:hypothetical protein